jgi:hypothetical protein
MNVPCCKTRRMAVTNDQSQKVTESPVEINFSLMKVIARTEQCAALEHEVVLLPGILITNAIALAWPTLVEKPARRVRQFVAEYSG